MCLFVSRPRKRDHSESPTRPSRVTRHSAKSVSRYDDDHITGSRSAAKRPQYQYGPRGDIVGVEGGQEDDEYRAIHHSRTSAPSTSRYDDEHVITSRPDHRVTTHGISASISNYDDEHVISASKAGGKATGKNGGPKGAGLLGMFSGESSHGSGKIGERRIGEKFVGSHYGPGKFLSGKSSMKTKGEGQKTARSGRPKEYGI